VGDGSASCPGGGANTAIARDLRVTLPTVRKWRERFARRRPEGLTDQPRPGAPRSITDEQAEQAVSRTLESKPRDATHWSTRGPARALGLSQTAVSQTWRAFGLKPHLRETFKFSTDPFAAWSNEGTPGTAWRACFRRAEQ
jgi:transposase